MSGARQISIRLAIEGAEEARRKLEEFGRAGGAANETAAPSPRQEAAWNRLQLSLDGNYRAAVQYANVVDRVRQAEAAGLGTAERRNQLLEQAALAHARATQAATASNAAFEASGTAANAASGGMRNFGVIAGQAGFQVQDFATQVAMGQNALVAFGVQFAQFAGALGAGGAIAGAVVTVGILATQFIDLGTKVEGVAEAERNLQSAMVASNEIYEDAITKANRLAEARVAAARVGIEDRLTAERASLRALNAAATDMEERRAFATGRIGGGGTNDNPIVRAERERIAQQSEQISARIAALDLELSRLSGVRNGGEQFGPTGEEGNTAVIARVREEQRELEGAARAAEQAANRAERAAGRATDRMSRLGANIYEFSDVAGQTVFPAADVQAGYDRQMARLRQEDERRQRELQRAAEANERRLDSAVQSYGDSLADSTFRAIEEGAEQGKSPLESLAAGFGSILRRAASQALSNLVFQPIIRAGAEAIGFTGAASGSGSSLGSLSSLTGLSSLMPAGGLSGITSGINQFAARTLPSAFGGGYGFDAFAEAAPSTMGLGGGSFLGTLGSAAGGFAIGSTLGSFTAGGSAARQTNGMIGAGIGTAAGFLLPGGPMVWGGIGGALGGLFGPGNATNAFGFGVTASGGQLGLSGLSMTGDGAGGDQTIAAARQQVEQINAALAAAGLTVRDNNRVVTGGGDRPTDGSQSATFEEALRTFRFAASNSNVQTALDRRPDATLDQALAIAQGFGQVQAAIESLTAEPVSALTAELRQISTVFDAARASAEEYGLSQDALNRRQREAVILAETRSEAGILGGLTQRSRILGGFLETRARSTGSAQSQFGAAQSQFEAALAAARSAGTESADLSGLVQSANSLLSANAAFNGGGAQAAAVETAVRGSIVALGGQLDLPGFTDDLTGAIARAGDRQVNELQLLRNEVTGMREELRSIRLLSAA